MIAIPSMTQNTPYGFDSGTFRKAIDNTAIARDCEGAGSQNSPARTVILAPDRLLIISWNSEIVRMQQP